MKEFNETEYERMNKEHPKLMAWAELELSISEILYYYKKYLKKKVKDVPYNVIMKRLIIDFKKYQKLMGTEEE